MDSLLIFLDAAVLKATPLVLAGLGGLLSERSGVINFALEGKMAAGAFAAAWVAHRTGSPWAGLAAGAAAGVVMGNQLARWFAVAVLGLNAIDMMFFLPAYPFWSLVIIAVDVVALYGLCAYGSRANLAA